eukprot:5694498-Pyramimonas_sp.AAC.1
MRAKHILCELLPVGEGAEPHDFVFRLIASSSACTYSPQRVGGYSFSACRNQTAARPQQDRNQESTAQLISPVIRWLNKVLTVNSTVSASSPSVYPAREPIAGGEA